MMRLGLGTTGRLILDGLEVCDNVPDQISGDWIDNGDDDVSGDCLNDHLGDFTGEVKNVISI